MNIHETYMKRALELAESAMGHTSPNPMVGCVVVKDGKILAEGCHEKYGEFHAERNALTRCTEDVSGADLYVTLEPCCHQGKTPPCTDIILEKKIGRVFVGAMDANPKVAGKGVRILEEHGIFVQTGILEEECLRLNEIFFHYISTGRPFTAMKYAMTLDGKIACVSGDSRWVTGETARQHVHFLRKKYSAILAGVDTVIADNPMLNCRIQEGVDPIRIICDSHLRIPLDSEIVRTANQIRTILVYAGELSEEEKEKQKKLETTGVESIKAGDDSQVSLPVLWEKLGQMKIDSVLVEGGGTLHGSLLESGLANRVYAYISPKLVGGHGARTPIEGNGIQKMADARLLKDVEILPLGNDICIKGDFV